MNPDLIQALTPIIVPLLLAFESKYAAQIPSWTKPIIASLLGILVDVIDHLINGGKMLPMQGAVLGAAGVGIREMLNQMKRQGQKMVNSTPTDTHP